MNNHLGEIGKDPVVSLFIGIGQRAAGDLPSESKVVELASNRAQADLDIPQAFPIRQLRKCQAQELIPAREATYLRLAVVALDAFAKVMNR
jgi:hypothetical protein